MNNPVTDLTIAEIVSALYHEQKIGYWDNFWPIDGSYSAHKKVEGTDVVVWRGSTTSSDWLQDFKSYATPSVIGRVHAGFLMGVQRNQAAIDKVVGENVIVCGHSLGAGHAVLHAAMRKKFFKPVSKVVVFGEPRSGDSYLQYLYEFIKIDSYKNRKDPVCDVPEWLFHAKEPLIEVNVAPDLMDSWGILADHHMKNYYEAMQGLFPSSSLSTNAYLGAS